MKTITMLSPVRQRRSSGTGFQSKTDYSSHPRISTSRIGHEQTPRVKQLAGVVSWLAMSGWFACAHAATYVVTSTAAAGAGTLDAALDAVNAGGGGTIDFMLPSGSVAVPSGTSLTALTVPVTLSSGLDVDIPAMLTSSQTVTLSGSGKFTIDAAFTGTAGATSVAGGAAVTGDSFAFINTGAVTGGAGGAGGASALGNGGGNGGAAVTGTGFQLTNGGGGTLTGGAGGGTLDLVAGNAGNGAAAVSGAGFTFKNETGGVVQGGAGGGNGNIDAGQGGNGGQGGPGVSAAGAADVITNNGTISGGTGGNGADAPFSGAGNGGAGGVGIELTGTDATVVNTNQVKGANGGYGGDGSTPGNGGDGGAGLVASGTGASVTNSGSITGGDGGYHGNGNSSADLSDAGGVGVILSGSNNTLINSGTIKGGMSNPTGTAADAIDVIGTGNTVELLNGSNISGQVVSTGANNTLALGGATNSTFNLGQIGTQYTGFAQYVKSGSSIWTLTNSSPSATNWTVTGGTLALASGASLGASSTVALAVSGAVFDISAAGNQALGSLTGVAGSTVSLGTNTLTLSNAASQAFDGVFSGAGELVKNGAGTQIINGDSASFAGLSVIDEGVLEVGDANHTSATLGGNVNVTANGTLRGHGTINGEVTNSGTVAPGGSIGTLTVVGNYTQASNATLSIEVSPTTASALNVGGSATLNGVLAITYDPGTYSAKQYALVSAAGGVAGTFSSVTSTGTSYLGTLTPSFAYAANGVDLVLTNRAQLAALRWRDVRQIVWRCAQSHRRASASQLRS